MNYISGRIFNAIPLAVILKGIIHEVSSAERENLISRFGTPLSTSTVEARFDPPRLVIGVHSILASNVDVEKGVPNREINPTKRFLGIFSGFSLSVGPRSSVVLDTPYVSDKLRLGLGARGSTFIFQRLPENDSAAMAWKVAYEKTPVQGKALSSRLFAMASIFFLYSRFQYILSRTPFLSSVRALNIFFPFQRAFMFLSIPLLVFSFLLAFGKGGIVEDDDSRELRKVMNKV